MKRGAWQWVGLVCVVACSRSNEPLPNKNTNWLNVCESADDCAAGQSCLCGICTTTCGAASECGRDGVEASCVPASHPVIEAQCAANDQGSAVAICVAECESAPDCEAVAQGFACSQGVCVQSAFAAPDGGLDAGDAGPDAGPDGGARACAPCAEGWRCFDGMCAQILAADQPGLDGFTRDGERLYWVNYGSFDQFDNYQHDGSIVSVAIGGGEIVPLAVGRGRPSGLQINDGYAYWVEGEPVAIVRVDLSDGTFGERILNAEYLGEKIAVDDAYVYFLGEGDVPGETAFKRTLKDGSGEPEDLIPYERGVNEGVRELGVAGDLLYWAGERWNVYAAAKDGSGETTMFSTGGSGNGTATSLDLESGAAYFAGAPRALYVGQVGDELLTLANVEAEADDVNSYDVALDTDNVYWTWTLFDYVAPGRGTLVETGGTVARTAKSPGDPEILWSSELLVHALIAIDDAYIYLAVRGGPSQGTVLRIAKETP